MSKDAIEEIRRIARNCVGVIEVDWPVTLHFGPDVILWAMDVEFASNPTADEVIHTVTASKDRSATATLRSSEST
jgi:hypothetical protein